MYSFLDAMIEQEETGAVIVNENHDVQTINWQAASAIEAGEMLD